MTVLEYLDLTLDTRSWVSLHNSLAFTQILLYYCKEFLWWLFQLQTDFQLTIFNSQIRSCHYDTGRVLCHISVVFLQIPFKPQKGTPTMITPPIHAKFHPIPSNGLPCRCDRPSTFFAQKIDHNCVNLNRIPAKIGTEMCFNQPYTYTKFQLNRSMFSQVMADIAKCAKWRRRIRSKKWRNYFETLLACISGLTGAICFKFGMHVDSVVGHLWSKFDWIQVNDLRAT